MPKFQNKRKSKRVHDLKPTRVTIKDHRLKVHNISNEGIGILLEQDAPRFVIGERLENISIPLDSGPVNLSGVVTHLSVTTEYKIMGIELILTGKQFNSLVRFKAERSLVV